MMFLRRVCLQHEYNLWCKFLLNFYLKLLFLKIAKIKQTTTKKEKEKN